MPEPLPRRVSLRRKPHPRPQKLSPTPNGSLNETLPPPADSVPASPAVGRPAGPVRFLAPPREPGELGRLGPYRVLRVLGEGGMGIVFHAEDVHLRRPVALKVLQPHRAADPATRQRFLREARAMAALKHEHIVSVYQAGEDRGIPYLAMELLEGESMDGWLARGRRPSVAQVLRLGREIARGLAAAHEKGLIHRDIKPANLWLERPQGRVKILDFGLVRADRDNPMSYATASGIFMGTPAYTAPEQARGDRVDARCDLFSLGCVLYLLCTGELPFDGPDAVSICLAAAAEEPRPIRELAPHVPPALAKLVMRLLAKDPEDRPRSAQAVVAALQAIEGRRLSATTPAPRPVPTDVPPARPRAATPGQPAPAPAGGAGRPPWHLFLISAGVTAALTALGLGSLVLFVGH